MARILRLALFLGAALLPAALAAPADTPPPPPKGPEDAVPNSYIITLKPNVTAPQIEAHLDWVADVHRRGLSERDGNVTAGVETTYNISGWTAYSGEFDRQTIKEIAKSPDVAFVELDYLIDYYDAAPEQTNSERALTTQSGATWGLGTISHRNPGSTNYIFDTSACSGTWAYVVDSGILTTHAEFGGRASLGFNGFNVANTDTLGHGTHVAGTIAGSTYGVCKQARVISVKVFREGASPTSLILAGFNWAVNDIVFNRRVGRAVINLSLGGPSSQAWTAAINAAYNTGILSVVAAGNGDENGFPLPVSSTSPANVPNALTVGAIDKTWRIASFSNYGAGVDLFAPGVRVVSSYIGSNTAIATLSGTSMATPHVAGLVLYLSVLENLRNPLNVTRRILGLATASDITGNLLGSPNLIAYNGNGA